MYLIFISFLLLIALTDIKCEAKGKPNVIIETVDKKFFYFKNDTVRDKTGIYVEVDGKSKEPTDIPGEEGGKPKDPIGAAVGAGSASGSGVGAAVGAGSGSGSGVGAAVGAGSGSGVGAAVCAGSGSGSGVACLKEDNIDYFGNDINNKIIGGDDDCANWCGETPGCTFWTFNKLDSRCWIKNSNSGRRSRFNVISGAKDCTTDDECVTDGGKYIGAKCIFPFIYDGTKYNGCAWTGHPHHWCPTIVDLNCEYVKDMWGNCASSCKLHSAESTK